METNQSTPRRGAFTGSSRHTQESGAMLGGKWWQVGDELTCLFQRNFTTKYGEGTEFMLIKPTSLTVFVDEFGGAYKKQPADNISGNDKQITRFALPPLAGFDMAVQDLHSAGFPGFKFGDKCIIRCTEIQPGKEFGISDMPMFEISVDPR
jgi:hypothetical protein